MKLKYRSEIISKTILLQFLEIENVDFKNFVSMSGIIKMHQSEDRFKCQLIAPSHISGFPKLSLIFPLTIGDRIYLIPLSSTKAVRRIKKELDLALNELKAIPHVDYDISRKDEEPQDANYI